MASNVKRKAVGISVRHATDCRAPEGGRCRCQPKYRGEVWDRAAKRPKKGPWFSTQAAARAWRVDEQRAARTTDPSSPTVADALDEMLAGALDGRVRNRSGARFKPSVIRSYRAVADNRLKPELGDLLLGELTQPMLYRYVARLLKDGLAPSTVRNILMPLRIAYREAVAHGHTSGNPTAGLRMPAPSGKRDRIADPEEAERLLAALTPADRAIWATALYTGLRRGELMALRWEDVDLDASVLRVDADRGSYDPQTDTYGPPKSRAAVRSVPIAARLRAHLPEPGRPDALVFGREDGRPFAHASLVQRADRAWKAANSALIAEADERAEEVDPSQLLTPIGLHACRHTFASYLIASGANAKAVTTALGHSSVAITFDRYGHLFPGHEEELRGLLDTYLGPAGRGAGATA